MDFRVITSCLLAFSLAGCAQAQEDEQEAETPSSFEFSGLQHDYVAERVAQEVSSPVSIDFLPDGRALVGQRDEGNVLVVDFNTGQKTELEGLPKLAVFGDAGLHDLELDPDFSENGWVYVSYSVGEEYHHTVALDRFRLDGNEAKDQQRLFLAEAYSNRQYHQGGRIQFLEGYLYLTIGDRQDPEMAQDRSNHAGTIVRLNPDGSVPEDNPFVGVEEERGPQPKPEIWSYGHRNAQGLVVHPDTGDLWSNEHGPRGGDEVNRIVKGGNYGWAKVSFGFQYDGGPVGMGITWEEGMEVPAWVWVPSIAPSDMVVYQGDAFPEWQGSFLVGAMGRRHLNRLALDGNEVIAEERLARAVLGRIRSIAVDNAGLIYLGSDNDVIWRLSPAPGR